MLEILSQLHQQAFLIINPRRRNGIILIKPYHAEFAGPGSVIGGEFDEDVIQVLPVGKLSLLEPQSAEEKIKAYLIRRQWILLTKQIADNPIPQQRAQVILKEQRINNLCVLIVLRNGSVIPFRKIFIKNDG